MKKIWNWQKQDLALYGMFWDTGSIVESIINSFDINPSKN